MSKAIESEIYEIYYDRNPDADARTSGLWRAVIEAEGDASYLADILADVKGGNWDE